jgi:HAD superfamily hydrolase (TIGR01459 family)
VVQALGTLLSIAPRFGAVVLDQWGVLHDGTRPYPQALATLGRLADAGVRLAVLSNSGKRAAPNLERIAQMGFDAGTFDCVITSGEALWRDIATGQVPVRRLCPIERAPGDAADWGAGLNITLTPDATEADAILLMGLPDDAGMGAFASVLDIAMARKLPVLCTNPDRASPRAGGVQVISPGALAHAYAMRGGMVRFYGKPHLSVFRSIEAALNLPPQRLLMVGDSLEHDIAGARAAGWQALLIEGGLHAHALRGRPAEALVQLARKEAAPLPDFTLPELC